MVKKLIFSLCAFAVLAGCKNNTVHISGTLVHPSAGKYIYLDELKSDQLVSVDSARIPEDGTFNFKKDVKSPSFYLLKLNNNNFMTMLVEPGEKIILRAHNDSLSYPYEISGSEGTMKMAEYNRNLKNTISKLSGLNRMYMENTDTTDIPAFMESLDSMAQNYLNEINSYTKKYIDENLSSLVSLVALYQQVAPSVYVLDQKKDFRYFVKVDSSLYSQYPAYEPVATLHEQVKELTESMKMMPGSATAMGETVPEISLPSPSGDTIRLSQTRGSVVLLDFWASWCPPCRQENPNLVKAYDMYHRKGFQIFQVSLDKTKEAWLQGIKDDNLGRWIHVSDVQYWNSIVVPLYKIESIPTNYLLDREGKIIATNLRGERLQQKLEEIFNQR